MTSAACKTPGSGAEADTERPERGGGRRGANNSTFSIVFSGGQLEKFVLLKMHKTQLSAEKCECYSVIAGICFTNYPAYL